MSRNGSIYHAVQVLRRMTRRRQKNVLLADGFTLLRTGLRCLLDSHPEFRVVAEAADGREALALAEKHNPDLIVIEAVLKGLSGVVAIRQLLQAAPACHVLILSDRTEPELITEALKAGATGYISKSEDFAGLLRALHRVDRGKAYLGPDVSGVVVDSHLRRPRQERPAGWLPELTPREREVLQLLAEGHTTNEIAATLFISPKTVGTHRQHIMKKLDLHTVADLTREAIRAGLVSMKG
jgi:two-component system response regulator NreC